MYKYTHPHVYVTDIYALYGTNANEHRVLITYFTLFANKELLRHSSLVT